MVIIYAFYPNRPEFMPVQARCFRRFLRDDYELRIVNSATSESARAEVAATDFDGMMAEAQVLRRIAKNVAIKVPLTPDGLRACKHLADDGVAVNVTLCFSPAQALLAAKAGAAYISPFVGRLDDIGQDGMGLIAEIMEIYQNYPFSTEVLVASVRHTMHVVQAAKLGAHVATLPPNVLRALFAHPLTDKGLAAFMADWAATGRTIV